MRIYDILNPFKLLCESQQLDEALSTDFSIGFELEGVCTREWTRGSYLPSYHSGRRPDGVVEELLNDLNKELGFGEGKIESDSSLNKGDDDDAWTFEYGSPIIKFNPANITKIYNFLKKLPSLQVKTNDSCGFHTHMSFQGINKINTAWVMCCLSIDDEILEELKEMKTSHGSIPFVSSWSGFDLFNSIKSNLQRLNDTNDKNYIYKFISRLLTSDDKYNLVRVHPAGTLEWRGPRNFLNKGNIEEIHSYILKVYKVISRISKILNSNTWSGNGVTIDKKEIEKNVIVTDRFNSPDQQRLDRKSKTMIKKIKEHPELLKSINARKLKEIISLDEESFRDFLEYNVREQKISEIIYNLSPEKINILYDVFGDRNKLEFYRSISRIVENGYNIISKLNDNNKEIFMNMLFTYFFNDNYIPSEVIKYTNFFGPENSQRLVNYVIGNKLQGSSIEQLIRYANKSNNVLPLDIYKYILNSKEFYYLREFNNLPIKVQRMMVRKNPYMVQYIQHIDPQILELLKKKYPNIEQYVLGEI